MTQPSSEHGQQTTEFAKRMSRHRRTSSVEIVSSLIPQIHSYSTSTYPLDEWTKSWEFDDTSDEEVPLPTLLEAAMRRAKVHAHVTTRLYALRAQAVEEKNALGMSKSKGISEPLVGSSILELADADFENTDLGVICPPSWRTTDWDVVLLDRTWLYDCNPTSFNQEGILIEPFLYMKKPKCIPLVYWRWLKGQESKGCETWAEGWTAEGPTRVWIQRWREGALTAKEWGGRRRVGFVLEIDVLEV